MAKERLHNSFYDSKKWLEKRKKILKRDKYIDQVHKAYSLIPKEANLVHHIFPLWAYPEYALEDWNLISVSGYTHNKLHGFNKEQLSAKGYALLLKTARKNNIDPFKDVEKLKKVYPGYDDKNKKVAFIWNNN